ncbi:ABC transporter permease, partial [uncultured Parabacteroides sp.]
NIFKKHSKQGDPATCEVQTMNQILDQLNTSENASLQLFTLLALFCTLISIFGLYSISSSNMGQRKKEIAVRKVMGASAGTIVKMFFREYLVIVLIANLLALPLAWLFMQNWLQQYAYRSSISAWMYILIIFVTVILIIGTVLYQTIRAARTNPAEVIKSE